FALKRRSKIDPPKPCLLILHGPDRAGLAFVLQSITLAGDLNDMRVMQQSVEQCRGKRLIVSQCGCPLGEGQVTGQDHAATFIALGDDIEEQVCFVPAEGQVTELVDDEQSWP